MLAVHKDLGVQEQRAFLRALGADMFVEYEIEMYKTHTERAILASNSSYTGAPDIASSSVFDGVRPPKPLLPILKRTSRVGDAGLREGDRKYRCVGIRGMHALVMDADVAVGVRAIL